MDFDGNLLKIIAGETLISLETYCQKGEKISAKETILFDKGREKSVVGLYFSSFHCPNCNLFTAQLKASFDKIRRTHSFEIIYIHLDEDDTPIAEISQQNEQLPWFALPSTSSKARAQLCKWLCIRTIPSLVLVDGETGRILTRNAQQRVIEDPDAINFPWPNRCLKSVLNETGLTDSNGASRSLDEIQGFIKGLYFSANWCPPCKAFTPHLVHTWNQLKNEKRDRFEVIFVSSDRSEESFEQYFGTMPWLAVPYDQDERRKELAEMFEVHGIPTLILLDEEDRVITRDGRHEVLDDPEARKFPWKPNLVEELTDRFSSQLNEAPLLILFTDSGELEQSKELLVPVASELKAQSQSGCDVMLFFVGGESELCDTIRELARLEDEVPLLCILDMQREEKYVFEEDVEMSAEVVRCFIKEYLNGDIRPEPFLQVK